MLTGRLRSVWLCDQLQITYTQLRKQPAWWVAYYMAYFDGKGKAEKQTKVKATAPAVPGKRRTV